MELVDTLIGPGELPCQTGMTVVVQYVGRLAESKEVFDKSPKDRPFHFKLGQDSGVIRGWHVGIAGMRVGGTRKFAIPPEKAYGKRGMCPIIPPNATLIFNVRLIDIIF